MSAAAGPDTLVVDIGAGIGALIVYTSDQLAGAQIEVCRSGPAEAGAGHGHGHPEHTIVRPRRLPHAVIHAGVFPRLATGDYTLLAYRDQPPRPFTIIGGVVTEVRW